MKRLWQNVSQRLEARPSHAWRWAVLCTALAGAAAGGLFWFKSAPSASPRWDAAGQGGWGDLGDKYQTQSDELAVTLGDGSSVKLSAQSEINVRSGHHSSAIAVVLARGEVKCDVTHREGKRFRVVAGDVEVRVVGTQFSVKTSSGPKPRVEVNVTRGVVEIASARRPGIFARVAAGQSWIQDAESAPPKPDSTPAVEPPNAEPEKHDAPQPSAVPAVPSGRELFEKAAEFRRAADAAAAAHS